jgi:hypothetical protein
MSDQILEAIKDVKNKLESVEKTQIEHGVYHKDNRVILEKIETDVDRVKEENIIQTKEIEFNRKGLDEHMAQTKLIDRKTDMLKDYIDKVDRKHDDKYEHAQEGTKVRKYLYDLSIKVGGGAGAMWAVLRVWDYLKVKWGF